MKTMYRNQVERKRGVAKENGRVSLSKVDEGFSLMEEDVESDEEELPAWQVEKVLANICGLWESSSMKTSTKANPGLSKIVDFNNLEYELHKKYYHSQLRLIRGLTSISTMLVEMKLPNKETKNYVLRLALKKLNKNKEFFNGVYIPIFSPSGEPFRVVRIPYAEAVCLNSRDRVPYMLNLEVISGTIEYENWKNSKNTLPSLPKNRDSKMLNEWTLINEPDVKVLDTAFGPNWKTRKERLKEVSPYGNQPGWDVISVIVKSGDDLRQEQLAMQMIQVFYEVFNEESLPLWLNPYMVLSTSRDAGLIETVHDAISIHGLKQRLNIDSLASYFVLAYGPKDQPTYKNAQRNFVESLAAYSLVCYLLQIKDRHNGNILIDREGHIIHIDYGFMLSSSPGNLQFETAPFKLPLEFIEVMGGQGDDMFVYFNTLIHSGYVAVRKHHKKILTLVELMLNAGSGKMACFQLGEITIANLKARFELGLPEASIPDFTRNLVAESAGNWRTGAYDNFQYYSNGIL
uniref:1-phosphatidylinositol 4-kinase n=1 Tax=Arcella intermedia TaxID=1963864 RepID=A0A6B2L1U4_9EUKA